MTRLVRKRRVQKEKSLLRKFIEVAWEQTQRKKALKILRKQQWSIDFLTYLLVKASKLSSGPIELLITSFDGTTLKLSSSSVSSSSIPSQLDDSDDIFNHLDNPVMVDEYIMRHGR